jgi:hypothetical protein
MKSEKAKKSFLKVMYRSRKNVEKHNYLHKKLKHSFLDSILINLIVFG